MISLVFYVEAGQHFPLTSRSAAIMPSITGNELKQYFVPGWGISRNILFSHIHFFLGPHASVRPYSYQGREGYLVITPGPPLTEVRTPHRAKFTLWHSLESISNPWSTAEANRRSAKPFTPIRAASGRADGGQPGSA